MAIVEDANNWDWETPVGLMTGKRRREFVKQLVLAHGRLWIGGSRTEDALRLDTEMRIASALERIAEALERMESDKQVRHGAA